MRWGFLGFSCGFFVVRAPRVAAAHGACVSDTPHCSSGLWRYTAHCHSNGPMMRPGRNNSRCLHACFSEASALS